MEPGKPLWLWPDWMLMLVERVAKALFFLISLAFC